MRTRHPFCGGRTRWVCAGLLALSMLLGTAQNLLADRDDHDRDRNHRDRETRLQINVNVGGPATPPPPPWVVDNRGPIHEAFAEPVVFDPKPGLVVLRRPPVLLNEAPPPHCPRGDDIRWIPGYWAWDDDRNDFVWISGIWRNIPPGREFVPGYWCETQGRYQWVPGCWQSSQTEVLQYLPNPPESLDAAATGLPPQPNYIWVPGVWVWSSSGYAWRPGYWIAPREEWVWVPDRYVWTPRGYVFVNGYWDYVMPRRGVLFAPVYLPPQQLSRPAFVYTPDVVVNVTVLIGKIFARPHYDHYYFGDYYDRSYFRSGIYPVVSYHNSRYGYDPIFAHHVAMHKTDQDKFTRELRDDYRFRRDHPEARPPRTYSDLQRMAGRNDVSPEKTRHLGMAQALAQVVNRPDAPFRFQSLPNERIDAARQTASQLRRYIEERRNSETRRPQDLWKGAVGVPLDQPAGRRETGTQERSGQPPRQTARSPQPSRQTAQTTPPTIQRSTNQANEIRIQRSPVGSRARNILDQLFKPTPTPPKASAPDHKIKPGSRVSNRREPQE
ncbi:MAG TPA: YXWGXW repeat-containing protein [Phycisphaerae bacterium]|nr:YXWGXW repeat-containing protein [Phycisphaerae bacterium]HRY70728.1 YXWGXW repeat-containing protein [Phycisphaerae bacterium]HSA28762.1 YXWGXW repeat-containing protein [Phycisphaerae bacterium]